MKFGGKIPLDYLLVRLPAACPWCDDPRGSEVMLALRDLVPGRKRYRGVNVRAVISAIAAARQSFGYAQGSG